MTIKIHIMIRTVIPKMRSSESLIYCGGKWQLLQLSKISFFNLDDRENRCRHDNNKNNKIHHRRAGSSLITRRFTKGFYRYISSGREAKENMDPMENKIVGQRTWKRSGVSMTFLPWALLAWSVLGFPVLSSGVWGHRVSPTHAAAGCAADHWSRLFGHFQVYGTVWDLSVGDDVTAKLLSLLVPGEVPGD